ncbi:MAG: polyprenyl diphosphate synthase [Planctomycetota bacterium]
MSHNASQELPRHVAIIMDGNGRWAQTRGLPRAEGHRRGASTVRQITEMAAELKLTALTLYCLSSENWKRPQTELDFLMELLRQYLIDERGTIRDQNIQLQLIGRTDRLSEHVLQELSETQSQCAANTGTKLVLAIDYGGRDELRRVMNELAGRAASGDLAPDQINEAMITQCLDTADLPEVDLMIRTGGDQRISNFLLWQVSYAELWFTEKCWPDFERDDFRTALDDFALRQRRYGGLQASR